MGQQLLKVASAFLATLALVSFGGVAFTRAVWWVAGAEWTARGGEGAAVLWLVFGVTIAASAAVVAGSASDA